MKIENKKNRQLHIKFANKAGELHVYTLGKHVTQWLINAPTRTDFFLKYKMCKIYFHTKCLLKFQNDCNAVLQRLVLKSIHIRKIELERQRWANFFYDDEVPGFIAISNLFEELSCTLIGSWYRWCSLYHIILKYSEFSNWRNFLYSLFWWRFSYLFIFIFYGITYYWHLLISVI